MSFPSFRLKVAGVCALMVGMLAFSTSAAQAETGAKWLILTSVGVVKTAEELPAELASSLENNDGSLLSKIVGIKFKLLCTAATLIGLKLEGNGSLTNGGKVKFTGCKVFLNEVEAPECEVHTAGEPVGTIVTNELKGLLVLHEPSAGVKEGVTRIEPKTGTTFVTLIMGAPCPLGNNIPIIGKVFVKDCEGKLTTHLVTHLIEELKSLTKLFVISETAEHVATLDGSMLIKLTGAHAGLAWSGMPA